MMRKIYRDYSKFVCMCKIVKVSLTDNVVFHIYSINQFNVVQFILKIEINGDKSFPLLI